jgi:hypothetical protein
MMTFSLLLGLGRFLFLLFSMFSMDCCCWLLQLLLAALEEEESSSFQDPRPWLWLVNVLLGFERGAAKIQKTIVSGVIMV